MKCSTLFHRQVKPIVCNLTIFKYWCSISFNYLLKVWWNKFSLLLIIRIIWYAYCYWKPIDFSRYYSKLVFLFKMCTLLRSLHLLNTTLSLMHILDFYLLIALVLWNIIFHAHNVLIASLRSIHENITNIIYYIYPLSQHLWDTQYKIIVLL